MSVRPSPDPLDRLLAEHRPPPLPEGLAARVADRAIASPQEPAPAPRPSRDRRGRWLRRPLLAGAGALGLAVSGALAATLAGVPLPRPVKEAIAELPFVPAPAAPDPRPAVRREPRPTPSRIDARPEPPPEPPAASPTPVPGSIDDRIARAHAVVAARRAAGLDTPRADRIERAARLVAERRAAGLPTPRADRVERWIERRRELERQGVAPAELDRLERRVPRAAIRRMAVRAELLRRAQAGDPEAIAIVGAFRRRRAERLEGTPADAPPPPEGFGPERR